MSSCDLDRGLVHVGTEALECDSDGEVNVVMGMTDEDGADTESSC